MSEIAISVENLSKKYQIGRAKQRHDTLRDALVAGLRAPFQHRRRNGSPPEDDTIWALKDVSFEVKQGEVVGVIGRNGAGKSTLLKILSQITEPTSGLAILTGRVGSLLEVGTGFHQELTGRENIYLSGAILGMRRSEIDGRFDQIVDFSGVEKFIDTPVKRYSSGMTVRLGFAVAAHLEPEILLVDEVLAVGDAAFQKKCLGKMGDVARQGRTVLFVSHNMSAVQELCSRGILIVNGYSHFDGQVQDAIAVYLGLIEDNSSTEVALRTDRRGSGQARLTGVEVRQDRIDGNSVLQTGQPAKFIFHYSGYTTRLSCVFTIYDHLGRHVLVFDSRQQNVNAAPDTADNRAFICNLEELLLLPGHYRINVALLQGNETQDHVEGAATFNVEEGLIGPYRVAHANLASIFHKHEWKTE
jgi:lipopolysaccharide transport system ATP-binding protein